MIIFTRDLNKLNGQNVIQSLVFLFTQGSVLHMKELLESHAEVRVILSSLWSGCETWCSCKYVDLLFQWDQSSTDVFKVLNECNPSQVCPESFSSCSLYSFSLHFL